jgi:hypothetical protein
LTKTKKRLTVPPFGHFLARIYDTTVESRTYQNDSAPRDSEKGKEEKKKRQGRASRLDADQLKENCSQQRRRRRQWLARPGRVNERSNRSRSLLGFSLFFFFFTFLLGFFFLFFLGSSLIFKPVEFPFVGGVEGRLATQTTNGIVGRTDG